MPEVPPQIPAAARRLATELSDIRGRVERLERGDRAPQLPHAALDGGALLVKDRAGTPLARLGMQHDGRAAVVYARGDPPPAPSPPVVAARQLALVVYWDGTFAGGAARPTDLARVDVHSSETAVYTPDGTTLIGSLVAEGAVSFAGDNDPKHIRLVAVTTSDVASEPTAAVTATPLPADQLAAGSIGAEQLEADLVLASRIIAGTLGAARIELDGVNNELAAYRPDGTTQTFLVDGDTGDVLTTGQLATDTSGARIVINPEVDRILNPQVIHFYPSSSDNYSEIRGSDKGEFSVLVLVGGRDTTVSWQAGHIEVTNGSVFLYWGNPEIIDPDTGAVVVPRDIRSMLQAEGDAIFQIADRHASANANWIALVSDPSKGPNEFHGIYLRHLDANGNLISNSDLQYTNDDGTRFRPGFRSSAGNIRLLWDSVNQELQVLNHAGTAWKPIKASDFLPPSSRSGKQNVRKPSTSALGVISNAPAYEWEYLPAPATTTRRPVDKPQPGGPAFEEVEIPAETTRRHIGPMAEDLPESLVVRDREDPDDLAVSLRDMVGTVWKAVEEIAQRLDAIESRL